ncbi:DUF4136 domain-containing protein [Pseudomonadales bacterium]|nr:DUF4136 domain-containing protein [Pseudomonadales bacterium]
MNLKTSLFFILSLFLVGCETTLNGPEVHVDSSAFFVDGYAAKGSIFVQTGDAKLSNSLEFQSYKNKFEAKLSSVGYTIAKSESDADYIAFVTYGIDNGETSTGSVPILGQTSGGSTYTSGTVYGSGGTATYSANSYSMPTFGVVGSRTVSSKQYTRVVAMDIVKVNTLASNTPTKVYEGRARSSGSCPVIVEVFDEILEAMFINYAAISGKSYNRKITSIADC